MKSGWSLRLLWRDGNTLYLREGEYFKMLISSSSFFIAGYEIWSKFDDFLHHSLAIFTRSLLKTAESLS